MRVRPAGAGFWCRTISGLNFINVLCTAFTFVDPKSVKDTDDFTVFFTLLGSTSTKAVSGTLMKLTPGLRLCSVRPGTARTTRTI